MFSRKESPSHGSPDALRAPARPAAVSRRLLWLIPAGLGLAAAVCLLLFLPRPEEGQDGSGGFSDAPGVRVELRKADARGATLALRNRSFREFLYGAPYGLYRREGGDWVPVPTLTGEPLVFITIAYTLPGRRTETVEIAWESGHGRLPPGRYKVTKHLTAGDVDYTVGAEFELPEAGPSA